MTHRQLKRKLDLQAVMQTAEWYQCYITLFMSINYLFDLIIKCFPTILINLSDLELQNLEAVWIEIGVKTKKILIDVFYRAPNSNADYFTLLNESIDRAHNTNIPDIVVTGDLNYNMHSNNNNKMKDLIQNYNLKQLIQEDTHFTESSSSFLDLILVRNSSNILTSGEVDSFIADQIRVHCPLLMLLV